MMDLIKTVTVYLQDFASKSESLYHVNPWIFAILFFGSAIPLYYGYYRIGKSVIKFDKKKFSRKEHINKKELRIGLAISIFAWWLPYIYVILFGKLPIDLWVFFGVFVIITGIFFAKALRKKVIDAEKDQQ